MRDLRGVRPGAHQLPYLPAGGLLRVRAGRARAHVQALRGAGRSSITRTFFADEVTIYGYAIQKEVEV